MLAGVAHLATAARGRFFIASHRTNRPKTCARSLFVVRVVASLTRVSPPQSCLPLPSPANVLGSLILEKKEGEQEERGSDGSETLCLCGAFAQFNKIKSGSSVEGSLSPSASSSRSLSIFKVTFVWRVVFSPAPQRGLFVRGASDPEVYRS